MIEENLAHIPFPELSREYRSRIDALPRDIMNSELATIVARMKLMPLVTAATILSGPLADKQGFVEAGTRTKATNLVNGYVQAHPARTALEGLTKVTTARIFLPAQEGFASLQSMVEAGGACNRHDRTAAEKHLRDTSCGGSVHFQVNGKDNRSYNRLFIALDKEGKPLLVYDTIEANDISRQSVTSYIADKCTDVFIGSVATSLAIAERMGIEYISLGDYELDAFAKDLGFGERPCFRKGIREKLGIDLQSRVAPHTWMIEGSSSFRTIDTAAYAPEALATTVEQAYAVMKRLRGHKEKARQTVLEKAGEDFALYFGIVQQIVGQAEELGLSVSERERVQRDITAFCQQYDLQPRALRQEDASEKETRTDRYTDQHTPRAKDQPRDSTKQFPPITEITSYDYSLSFTSYPYDFKKTKLLPDSAFTQPYITTPHFDITQHFNLDRKELSAREELSTKLPYQLDFKAVIDQYFRLYILQSTPKEIKENVNPPPYEEDCQKI